MSFQIKSKNYVNELIQHYENASSMQADIKQAIEQCKHYKEINKKFFDQCKKFRIYVNHVKNSWLKFYRDGTNIYYDYSDSTELTWKRLLEDLNKDYELKKKEYEEVKEFYDTYFSEIILFSSALNMFIQNPLIGCSRFQREIENEIERVKKENKDYEKSNAPSRKES